MNRRSLTLVVTLSVTISVATLIGRGSAIPPPPPGCCVCLCGLTNSTMAATAGLEDAQTMCSESANYALCLNLCNGMNCGAKFAANASCSDPELAEFCGAPSMAPASSPAGLVALAAILSGLGAFYLRRRSLRS